MNLWQEVILALGLAIGLSMDAATVAMTNGLKYPKLRKKQVLIIAIFFGVFQGVMPLIGYFGGSIFQDKISQYTAYIALILLSFLGGKMIYSAIKSKNEIVEIGVKKEEETLGIKNLFIQAFATSIDALAVGVIFVSSVDENPTQIALLNGAIICMITLSISYGAVYIGKKFGGLLKHNAQILGGIILIAIGILIFVNNLNIF